MKARDNPVTVIVFWFFYMVVWPGFFDKASWLSRLLRGLFLLSPSNILGVKQIEKLMLLDYKVNSAMRSRWQLLLGPPKSQGTQTMHNATIE